ncbi:type I-E CRISPR-associated endoribonuclease Cas2e [Amycolatopsis panacis]|uniref:Type I-E CRISPR-associated endoribonuclease Cas2 n=1 Tax=Amycolatopsis panacis TaxID=2340917 RepID=A0A419I988_9PSEU|nr:type I-E CRISPR-associated endoribonuclease Cas2e [Amycolatopsis panacis]RJQ89100.1 type I-E CRISPR-associated endoribonuclease Cas2 [Amycolatopsis panacis]
MTVLVIAACPVGLRGHLTRWLLEISPGVFIGTITTLVHELLWNRVIEMVKNGRAIMVFHADNEQGMDFHVHNHTWHPTDYDGIQLMLRPTPLPTDSASDTAPGAAPTRSWSTTGRLRRYGRR